MEKNHFTKHHELDRDGEKHKMLIKYSHLKFSKKSNLTIDEQLFLQNFEAAMQLMWVYKQVDISKLLKQTSDIPLN